ncbi:MAG: outer membrane protein assembly factor BamD [Bacteroidota bacterium]
MTKKNKHYSLLLIISAVLTTLILVLTNCSSSQSIRMKNAEEYFNEAMTYFKNEDYVEAQRMFDAIKLQFPASQYADDAQYYLAETNFKRKEFILAAFNYGSVRRIYPQSEYCKVALFKTALCFNELSPPYDRDQDYTIKAINAFTEYQTIYPNDSLYKLATENIVQLRNKLANREYFIAELYRKLYSPGSSLIYYDQVINEYPDTKFYEPALFGKIEVLSEMKKTDDTRNAIDSYKKLFPNGPNINKVKFIESSLKK